MYEEEAINLVFMIILFGVIKWSNIPESPAYGVYISQLIRYARACSSYQDFITRGRSLAVKLMEQGYTNDKLKIYAIQDVFFIPQVIGVDISSSQIAIGKCIAKARGLTGLDFQIGKGENLDIIDDSSVDLVTVGTAIHWMVENDVYKEVKRVLKPGGVFIVYGYGQNMVDKKEAYDLIWKVYDERIHPYNKNRNHVYNVLNDYELPFENWRRDHSVKMHENWSVGDFINFIKTVSPSVRLLKEDPQATVFEDLQKGLEDIYKCKDDETKDERRMDVTWPITMLIAWK